MNNIKSFNEYTGQELEQIVYDQELNEGIMGKGIRGFFNKSAARKVRAELADEIEMSKSIMDGIKEGLEAMNDDFDAIKKSLDDSDENDKKKGDKQKLLEEITKILENSRKNTWDLNELIDEGEIDYTGFTANIGIATVANFGVLFTPFRSMVMIHKGYRYFFNIIKNTVRKSLVMLQVNFDQFENLIVTQSLRCAGVITATDTSGDIGEFYGNICAQIAENKSMSKKQLEKVKTLLNAAKNKFDQQVKADKLKDTAENLYNNLDPYNNTYTKSLEVLRQYSGDDVQKHLDAIKTSMNKLAGQDVDLQTYAELIIAAAEEHAYEVSSSIYNKFAKMTEVFSLPNQQKLIDLILAANKEDKAAAKKLRDEKKAEKLEQEKSEKEEKCTEIFEKIEGTKLGELDKETNKYDESKIKAEGWTYDEFIKLEKDDRDVFESWLNTHREVLKKCDESLQMYVDTPFVNSSYIDSLIDYIGPYVKEIDNKKKRYKINSSYFMNFDEFVFESSGQKEYELSDEDKKEIEHEIDDMKSGIISNVENVFKLIFGSSFTSLDDLDGIEIDDEQRAKLNYLIDACKNSEGVDKDILNSFIDFEDSIDEDGTVNSKHYITFKDLDDNQVKDLRKLYVDNEKLAIVAFKVIGEKILNNKTFAKNSKSIVTTIKNCVDSKYEKISFMTYTLLKKSIEKLDDIRNHDYADIDKNDDEDTKKSEK